jgi:hypothetical protein
MKEFIYLFRGGKTDNATDQQLRDHEHAWDEWMDALEQENVLIDGLPIKDHSVVLKKDGGVERETYSPETITGYLILEAPDFESAVEMAKDCPIFEFDGTIEVRELESHLDDLHEDENDDGFRDIDA